MSRVTVRYIGSGPYCYANSLAMMLDSAAPEPALIEVLTGSPFGAALISGIAPFFNPLGWDPGVGLDAAIDLLGWNCRLSTAGSDTDAAARLREASASRPLLVGPLEIGLLLHHPDSGTAIGSDHYMVVTCVEKDIVRFHDPHGHPHATLPMDDFIAAWRADSIGYATEPFTARAGFQRVRDVDATTALRRALPMAARWLAGEADLPALPRRVERLWRLIHLADDLIAVGAPANLRERCSAVLRDQPGVALTGLLDTELDSRACVVGLISTGLATARPVSSPLTGQITAMRGV